MEETSSLGLTDILVSRHLGQSPRPRPTMSGHLSHRPSTFDLDFLLFTIGLTIFYDIVEIHPPHSHLLRLPDRLLDLVSRQLFPHGQHWIAVHGSLRCFARHLLDDRLVRVRNRLVRDGNVLPSRPSFTGRPAMISL